jgi:hypothetical protein
MRRPDCSSVYVLVVDAVLAMPSRSARLRIEWPESSPVDVATVSVRYDKVVHSTKVRLVVSA